MSKFVLGLSGGPDTLTQQVFNMSQEALSHDGAAVLIRDGAVVAAVEEERLNRVKHSNLFPVEASRYCLDKAGISIAEVDKIAFYLNEGYVDGLLMAHHTATGGKGRAWSAKDLLSGRLKEIFGVDVRDKLVFVDHHVAHAYSTFPYAGSKEALVLIMDGAGEFSSGLIGRSSNGQFSKLADLPQSHSLGGFYLSTIKLMGLSMFDEYKAMGLAPYGDPAVFRDLMRELYLLKEDGQFEVANGERLVRTLLRQIPMATSSNELEQCHRDLAASLQEALEEIVFHILRHWRTQTGLEHLCLAGGVAHNCTMNGKILASGLFKTVFVQPAAHDAGCALGAANYAAAQANAQWEADPIEHVYWGPAIGHDADIEAELDLWQDWLDVRRSDDVVADTAALLASGNVIGWVQGASEFGPRALGNRSIIADPRPADNRARINFMIKKREGFRPFAPSVTVEAAQRYFDLGSAAALPFMSYVVPVRAEHRASLGAITHVDGTARVQTVSQASNARYWALLNAFGTHSGVPMLLNTSFNNNVEPVVDSVRDAIACFLTTELDRLVIDDFIATKRGATLADQFATTRVQLVAYAKVVHGPEGASVAAPLIKKSARISPQVQELLTAAAAHPALAAGELLSGDAHALSAELRSLWEKRLIEIRPQNRRRM